MIETIFAAIFLIGFVFMGALVMWGTELWIRLYRPPLYVRLATYLFAAVTIIFLLYCAYWVPIVVYTDLTTFDFMG